jgi:hypothetical protein
MKRTFVERLETMSRENLMSTRESRDLRSGQPIARRMAMTALSGVINQKYIHNIMLEKCYGALPLDFMHRVGSGGQQLVYEPSTIQGVVKKLLKGTLHEDLALVRRSAEANQRTFDTMERALGVFVHPTSYEATETTGGSWVVTAVQERLDELGQSVFHRGTFAHTTSEEIDLSIFAQRALGYIDDTGMLPDLLGPSNVVLLGGSPLLIDNLPHTPDEGRMLMERGLSRADEVICMLKAVA